MARDGLLDDLLNIEVDVVIADHLERTAMPVSADDDLEPAIGEVVDEYVRWLDRHFPAPEDSTPRPGEGPAAQLAWVQSRAEDAARLLAEAADAGRLVEGSWPSMLHRIGGNAAQLRAVVERDVVEPVDRTRIVRKAWELGTGTIVAQTVVQLDGDVVTRIDEDNLFVDDRAALRRLHRDAVREAIAHWRVLVELVTALVTSVLQVVFAIVRHPGTGWKELKRRWNERRERDDRLPVRDLLRKETWTRIRADWSRFRENILPLFADGGATIESSAGDPPYARTIIQPDGDVLWFVSAGAADDEEALEAHSALVTGWYDGTAAASATVRQIVAAFQRAIAGALAVLWTAATVASGIKLGWWALAAGAAAAVVAVGAMLIARAGLGHWIGKAVGLASR
jgi:hypothetical protein